MRRTRLAARLTVGISLAMACTPPRAPSVSSLRLSTPASSEVGSIAQPALLHLMSEPGRYEVQLPVAEGMMDYTQTTEVLNRPIECHITFSRLDYGYAAVEYCDLPAEVVADLAPQDVLARTRMDLLRPFRTQVASEQAGKADDNFSSLAVSGRADMRGQGYDGSFEARLVLADGRVYLVLMAASDADQCGCLSLTPQVVDSFHVVPDLSIPYQPPP
jgi:hypothetical protein